MDLRLKTQHGLTECVSDDPEEQKECPHNPKKERSDKSNHCFCFRNLGDDLWVCNGREEE